MAISLALLSLAMASTTIPPCSYTLPGPYEAVDIHDNFTFSDIPGRCDSKLEVKLTLTKPARLREEEGHFPAVVLINGFKMKASFYKAYAAHLASWGYVVLQYDTPLLRLIEDTVELDCLEELLDDWLAVQNATPGSPVWGMVDMTRIGLVGHSKGAKLAALHFARSQRFRGAFLIDPVDNTSDAPESPTCPSAAKALRASGKEVGIMGAGIVARCNPEGSNYKEFYEAAGNGSWLAIVNDCGHQQFLDAGFLLNRGFDLLCRAGQDSRQEVRDLTKTPLVAWLDHTVRGASNPLARAECMASSPLDKFFEWVKKEVAAGMITFSIKSSEGGSLNNVVSFPRKALAEAKV